MYESLLSSLAGGSSGQGGGSYGNEHGISTDTGLNINSVGLNLGSILQPFREGNSATGGYDLELLSRMGYIQPSLQPTTILQPSNGIMDSLQSNSTMLIIGGIGLVVVFMVLKKRR